MYMSSFLVQIDSYSSPLAMMPVMPSLQIVTIIIIIIIQTNQSYSDSRHVKYIINIKCNSIIIQ